LNHRPLPAASFVAVLLGTLVACCVAPAALAMDNTREDVRSFSAEMVSKHGFDPAWVDTMLLSATSQPAIIEAMNRPAEKTKPWFEYRGRFISERRIREGVAFWQANREPLERIAAERGVPPEIIVGIIGVETFYGTITGKYRVLDALATLAFDYPPRAPYFRAELEEFLLLAREHGMDPLQVTGSYAGAMGAPQFMPRSVRAYARDGDGNDKIDLWSTWPDVFASVANFLKVHGWVTGEPVVVPATLFDPDNVVIDGTKLATQETVDSLQRKGVEFEVLLPESAPTMFVAVRGPLGPAHFVGYKNLWVITRYNRSVLYAMTVNELAESVRLALAQADAAGPMAAPSVAPTAAPTAAPTVAPTAAPVAAAPSASPPTL
jgi:membrane-bound lytic murein transglycosylase B